MSIDIVVCEEVLLQRRFDLREHKDHFFKFLLVEETDHSIDLRSHTGGSWLSSEEADLTEEFTSLEDTYEGVTLLDGILNEYFAFTVLDEEETVVFFALVNQWILGIKQHQLQGLDEEINQ